jgi:hypothetical protein
MRTYLWLVVVLIGFVSVIVVQVLSNKQQVEPPKQQLPTHNID